MPSAVVLLSGGLDSSTTLAIARKEDGCQVHALTFAYGQRHHREVDAARRIAEALGVLDHRIQDLDLSDLSGSALTDPTVEVPQGRPMADITQGIPPTYVPARNTILLAYALAWAEVAEADAVYIGANHLDASGYPDCRPEFYRAFQEVARLGTKRGVEGHPVEIRHPLIDLTKAQIVRRALDLGVPLELTWSCYLGGKEACGVCDTCQLRLRGFQEAGAKDPLAYADYPSWYRRKP